MSMSSSLAIKHNTNVWAGSQMTSVSLHPCEATRSCDQEVSYNYNEIRSNEFHFPILIRGPGIWTQVSLAWQARDD